MTLSGAQVTALDISVDTTTLTSDDERRDNQLRERGLETDAFPTATFSLTQPIEVGKVPDPGERIEATATGDLTLHGVTKQVTVPVTAQWTGERTEIVGSIDITITDFGIEKPTGLHRVLDRRHGHDRVPPAVPAELNRPLRPPERRRYAFTMDWALVAVPPSGFR